MKREIKFRVWHKEDKKYIYDPIELELIMLSLDITVNNPSIGFASEYFEFFDFQQFTGLTDKKGREIYDGDIVKSVHWNPEIMQVCFDRGAFYLAGADRHELADIKYVSEFEVIGNIYENPDLINK